MLLLSLGFLDLTALVLFSLDQLLLVLAEHVGGEGRAVVSDGLTESALLKVATVNVPLRLHLAKELTLPADFAHFNVSSRVALEEHLFVLSESFDPAAEFTVLHKLAVGLCVSIL